MYTNGDGVPKDPSKAEYWNAKADRDKTAAAQAEQAQAADRQKEIRLMAQRSEAPRNSNASGMLMLGLILGAMDGGSDTPHSPPAYHPAEIPDGLAHPERGK